MAERAAAVAREILHKEGFYPEESTGLFVGISMFEDERFGAVRFAVDDAVDLAWVFSLELGLVDAGRCVLALAGEPQKKVSQERLAALLAAGAKREVPRMREVYRLATQLSQAGGERGIFVLAASTHGLSESGGDFLIAFDSLRERLFKTAIEVKDLFESAATAVAGRRLVLLDACRERLSQGTKSIEGEAMSQSFASAIAKATGLTVLSGSTVGGYAYDDSEKQNGVFSGALVDGLCGAAPADERGFITVSTLAEFAQQRVEEWVRQHRSEHLGKSRGIEHRFDEAAKGLPLAIDPRRSQVIKEYQRRRALALVRLRENIGNILKGRTFDELESFLPREGAHSAEVLRLLSEVETLDGSERAQRSLLHLFEELRRPPVLIRTAPRNASRRTLSIVAALLLGAAVVPGARWIGLGNPSTSPAVGSDAPVQPVVLPAASPPRDSTTKPATEPADPTPKPMADSAGEASKELISQAVGQVPQGEPPVDPSPRTPGQLAVDHFGIHYRWIPGGKYLLGSPMEDKERYSWENKPEPIALEGFWLAETEVTQAFWMQQGLRNPSRFSSCPQCPVEQVSWYDAVAFANLLSEKAGLESCYELKCKGTLGEASFECSSAKLKSRSCSGYRLPTEAEWEVAARAQVPGSAYQARYGEVGAIAWYDENSGGKTHPIGEKAANHWDLRDMLGNVGEWTNGALGSSRVVRGGSWSGNATYVRAAYRNGSEPAGLRSGSLGLRLSLGRAVLRQGARSAAE